ncbi:MAG: SDR family NAD(P)-dependent oxidoreductase, partial [Rhizobiales bacterium]|nr:SDR family NAD(P)-dependent oxidoreductase [Hyphomicrobiales bacterium]
MTIRLLRKVVIVTGGSRGIGAAAARLIAAGGAAVVVNYAQACEAAERLVTEIEASGGEALAVQGDVANEDDVLRLFRETEERCGRPSGLVNNAGIIQPQMRFEAMTAERFRRIVDVNLIGTLLCAR